MQRSVVCNQDRGNPTHPHWTGHFWIETSPSTFDLSSDYDQQTSRWKGVAKNIVELLIPGRRLLLFACLWCLRWLLHLQSMNLFRMPLNYYTYLIRCEKPILQLVSIRNININLENIIPEGCLSWQDNYPGHEEGFWTCTSHSPDQCSQALKSSPTSWPTGLTSSSLQDLISEN